MEKTVVQPSFREVDSSELDEPASSYATITDHGTHRRVLLSGGMAPGGDLAEQVHTILEHKRTALKDLGGGVNDIVRMQFFVRADSLNRDARTRIHEVRAEFFDREHYPASTMVGVADLLHPDARVEIELEAEIPDTEWEPTVYVPDED